MKKENIYNDLKEATRILLEMARNHSWNSISDECLYIIRRIKDFQTEYLFKSLKIRKKENETKKPKTVLEIASDLKNLYENLFVVDLYVYKSTSKLTIIEIQYYSKLSLEKEYFKKVKDNNPMLHCKVSIPPYLKDEESKFDINWELCGLRYTWNIYWWGIKLWWMKITKKNLKGYKH